jgi:uncharacterized protein
MKFIIFYIDNTANKIFTEKTDEAGEKHLALSSQYNFVKSDELIARIVDADQRDDAVRLVDKDYTYYHVEKFSSIKAGEGIYFDEINRCYKATSYGFAVYVDNKLKLLTPLQITRDKMSAFYIVFPTKFKYIPDYKEIEENLFKRNIITIVDKDFIEEELRSIDENKPGVNRIVVAKGKEPITGNNEYFIPLLSMDKKAGKVLEDGSIDFKQVDSIIDIKKGDSVLRRIPPVKPENGYNIYGEIAEAMIEEKKGYKVGKNISSSVNDIFISNIDGCIDVDGNRISVQPIALIKGDVDYDCGNIDFNGSVHIFGSVLPGFSVKAGGDIIIEKNADNAYIEAGGDITIKSGITGKGSGKVIAGGKVKANYILNSTVEAVGEIEIEDSIINSKVFSNDKVMVTSGHGKIMGGEVTARHEVVVNIIGTQKENITNIIVGKSLYIEREIIEINKNIEKSRIQIEEIIRNIKTSFGEGVFENPKEFLGILPDIKKKNLLKLLKSLSDSNTQLKQLAETRKAAEDKLKLEREPVIIVNQTIFPGTVITIKKRRKIIDEKLDNVKLFEDANEKIIKITSAV